MKPMELALQCERILGGNVLIESRERMVYLKRAAIIRYMRNETGMTLMEIGAAMSNAECLTLTSKMEGGKQKGRQHHATIINAIKRRRDRGDESQIGQYTAYLNKNITLTRDARLGLPTRCKHCGQIIRKRKAS